MFTIRKAAVSDAKNLGMIHALSWKKAYEGIVPKEILDKITPEKRAQFFKKALTLQWEEDYLLTVDDLPAGLLCLGKARDEDCKDTAGEIWGIYLHPDFYGQGYGRVLLEYGLSELQKRGYESVLLWVLKDNIHAIQFYEHIGFCKEGAEKDLFIGKPLTEVRYSMNL
jgi:ribosomal protein S18 acetylase RimI-like enzyme